MESIHSFQLKKLVNIQEAFEGLLQCITLHLKILLFSGSRKKKAKSSHQNATCDPVQTQFAFKNIDYNLYLLFYYSMDGMTPIGHKS